MWARFFLAVWAVEVVLAIHLLGESKRTSETGQEAIVMFNIYTVWAGFLGLLWLLIWGIEFDLQLHELWTPLLLFSAGCSALISYASSFDSTEHTQKQKKLAI